MGTVRQYSEDVRDIRKLAKYCGSVKRRLLGLYCWPGLGDTVSSKALAAGKAVGELECFMLAALERAERKLEEAKLEEAKDA